MKRGTVFFAVVLSFMPAAVAKKSSLRAELLHARFVYVTTFAGNPEDARLYGVTLGDDRRAVADVEAALRKWGRWTLISSAEQADLIITVRRGRAAATGVRVPIGDVELPPRNEPGIGRPRMEAEAGPAEDMIAIYSAKGWPNRNYPEGDVNRDAPPLWRLIQAGALSAPSVPGVQQLRKQIEKAEAENARAKK